MTAEGGEIWLTVPSVSGNEPHLSLDAVLAHYLRVFELINQFLSPLPLGR